MTLDYIADEDLGAVIGQRLGDNPANSRTAGGDDSGSGGVGGVGGVGCGVGGVGVGGGGGVGVGGGGGAIGVGGAVPVLATPPRTPVIALTAYNDSACRQMCMDAGMDSFITKPVLRSALVDQVVRALQGDSWATTPEQMRT